MIYQNNFLSININRFKIISKTISKIISIENNIISIYYIKQLNK